MSRSPNTARILLVLLIAVLPGAAQRRPVKSAPAAPPQSVTVSAPTLVRGAGSTFLVLIDLSDPSNAGIGSYQFGLDYDPNIINPTGPNSGCDNTGTLSGAANHLTTCNVSPAGTLLVSDFGSQATSGSGTLLKITFTSTSTGPFPAVSPLHFHDAFFFTLTAPLPVVTNDGQITILGPTAANVAISGRVLNAGGFGIA